MHKKENLELLLEKFNSKTFENPNRVLNSLSELNEGDIEDYVRVKGFGLIKKALFTLTAGALGSIALNHQISREMECSDYLIVGGLWFGALCSVVVNALDRDYENDLSEFHTFEWQTSIQEKVEGGLYRLTTESVKDPRDNSFERDLKKMAQKLEEGKMRTSPEYILENEKNDNNDYNNEYVFVNGVLVTECEPRNETADVIDFKTGTKLEEESYSTNFKVVTKNEFGIKTADAYIEAPTNKLLGKDRSLLGKELWMLCKYEKDGIRVIDYGPAIIK
ncbi:hypothetical protein HON71_03705 [Candidatus Woesearchaeota archaeon]|jgi:hypothetical protein|nr:hypothetical protein [Candidatus Woesearchaeota archaeon]MBT5342872.1 hypothetical protein [Candidatus Woesearchaeota archaeon]